MLTVPPETTGWRQTLQALVWSFVGPVLERQQSNPLLVHHESQHHDRGITEADETPTVVSEESLAHGLQRTPSRYLQRRARQLVTVINENVEKLNALMVADQDLTPSSAHVGYPFSHLEMEGVARSSSVAFFSQTP